LLGYYKDGVLKYAGKLGTGYGHEMARELFRKLKPLQEKEAPFTEKIGKGRRGYVWVKPELLCQVAFWEWTADGHIRHASFKGLREDKPAAEAKQEMPERSKNKGKAKKFSVEGVAISHPEREVFPGITKGAIAEYYGRALPYMFPFLDGRLLTLLRCTDTAGGECFYQRAPMQGLGNHVRSVTDTHNGNKHNYFYVDRPEGVIGLVQMGAIEFHAWQSHGDNLQKPDQMIFDLDPGEGVPFEAVRLAAEDIRNRLEEFGLESFPRLTGGKGVHVVAPFARGPGWDEVKPFAQRLALSMQRDAPDAYVAVMTKAKRGGKIFVDYLRNDYSATAIVPFSLRARPGAPVAVLVTWRELAKMESPAAFNFGNVGKRMNARTRKMIDEFMRVRQTLKG
jgi:bifunctional non-homologous end joining protein LigD